MAADRAPISRQQRGPDVPSTAELIDRLSEFDGPPEQFLVNLLAVQCHITSASGGAILRAGPSGSPEVIAVYPPIEPDATAPVWLAQSVEYFPKVLSASSTAVVPLHTPDEMYGQPAQHHIVLLPLKAAGEVRGAASFAFETSDQTALAACRERLELTIGLLSLYEMRLTLQRRGLDLQRIKSAMDILSAVNEHDRFAAAGMAFCNETAAHWECDRVSVGFLQDRYVHVKATSYTEKFSRKMKMIQDIEAAMEECLDQDAEIIHPAHADATYVSRSAAQLSAHHGPATILSLPLRRDAQPTGVITLERPIDRPFSLDQIEGLRLMGELCTPRLVNLYRQDRWIGARAAAEMRKGLGALLGPKHTWIKVAAIAIFAALVFLTFVKGPYRADAPFVLQAVQRRVITAPYDGFLKTVHVEPGDTVTGGQTLLATLDTTDLRSQLAAAKAKKISYLKEAARARHDGKRAESQIADAQADEANAQIALLTHQIEKARIVPPISGILVTGDLKRQIGAPVKVGNVLFEVAPLKSLRAELSVPEDQIADVREDQRGELATAAYPNERIGFVVERINPVAEVVAQRNVFKVRVRLHDRHEWMRPGMEGTAKIRIDRRTYGWLWTRRLRNWLRMKLWW